MRPLIQTPDILLIVIELSDIDTLLSLRLTNRGIHNLISLYESTISQAVAKVTFPTEGLLLRPPSDSKFTIMWLISLIPKQLAAIAVDRGRCHDPVYQPWVFAENPEGDPLRERVDRGWRILQKLSLIARDVNMISEADLLLPKYKGNTFRFSLTHRKKELEIMARREHLITQTRLEYCRTLESSDILGYELMERFLQPSLLNVYPYLLKISNSRFNWTKELSRSQFKLLKLEKKKIKSIMRWMKWFILKEGPSLFWEQWWTRSERTPQRDRTVPGLSALDRMLRTYSLRSKKQIRIETEAASCITSYFGPYWDSAHEYLEEMIREREASYLADQTPRCTGRTLEWVPFFFERCPLTHERIGPDTFIMLLNQRAC